MINQGLILHYELCTFSVFMILSVIPPIKHRPLLNEKIPPICEDEDWFKSGR